MVWIKDKPRLDGEWYWWRPTGDNSKARPIKVDFNNPDFQMDSGEWSHCPIPLPNESEDYVELSEMVRFASILKGRKQGAD